MAALACLPACLPSISSFNAPSYMNDERHEEVILLLISPHLFAPRQHRSDRSSSGRLGWAYMRMEMWPDDDDMPRQPACGTPYQLLAGVSYLSPDNVALQMSTPPMRQVKSCGAIGVDAGAGSFSSRSPRRAPCRSYRHIISYHRMRSGYVHRHGPAST